MTVSCDLICYCNYTVKKNDPGCMPRWEIRYKYKMKLFTGLPRKAKKHFHARSGSLIFSEASTFPPLRSLPATRRRRGRSSSACSMFVEAQELKWLEISTCKRTEHFEPSSICSGDHGAPNAHVAIAAETSYTDRLASPVQGHPGGMIILGYRVPSRLTSEKTQSACCHKHLLLFIRVSLKRYINSYSYSMADKRYSMADDLNSGACGV